MKFIDFAVAISYHRSNNELPQIPETTVWGSLQVVLGCISRHDVMLHERYCTPLPSLVILACWCWGYPLPHEHYAKNRQDRCCSCSIARPIEFIICSSSGHWYYHHAILLRYHTYSIWVLKFYSCCDPRYLYFLYKILLFSVLSIARSAIIAFVPIQPYSSWIYSRQYQVASPSSQTSFFLLGASFLRSCCRLLKSLCDGLTNII